MLLCYFLLLCGSCQSAVLPSKNLQGLVGEYCGVKSLVKAEMVRPNWISVETVYNRITPMTGLLENKATKEIIFETKTNSLNQDELVEKLGEVGYWDEEMVFDNIRKYIKRRQWGNLCGLMVFGQQVLSSDELSEVVEGLSEIVNIADFGKGTQISEAHNGRTILHQAARHNRANLIEILVKKNAAINTVDIWLRTPIWRASLFGHYNAVKVLLNYGANPNLPDSFGRTALHEAYHCSESRFCDVVEILLSHGADPFIKDKRGTTALMEYRTNHQKTQDRCQTCSQRLRTAQEKNK